MDITPDHNSFLRSFSQSGTLSTRSSKMMTSFLSPKKKKKKYNGNVPAPLNLKLFTPPPTVRAKRTSNELELTRLDFGTPSRKLSYYDDDEDSPTLRLSSNNTRAKNRSFLRNKCSYCEEPLTSKLNGEKIIELECNHQCHYNCYLLLINGDDINDHPVCSICDTKSKPSDLAVLEELQAASFTQGGNSKTNSSAMNASSKSSKTLLPPFVMSSTPKTPIDQILYNRKSAGFQETESAPRVLSSSGSFSSSSSSLSSPSPSVDVNLESLLMPTVNIIFEQEKIRCPDNQESCYLSSVANIFLPQLHQSETNDGQALEELEIKSKIDERLKRNFSKNIQDLKGINLQALCSLRMFDYVNISLDGENWELVQSFIFERVLLLLNFEGDSIIGTIMVKDHFTKSVKINESTIILYLKSTTLPELQIHSENSILISKWIDFFDNKIYSRRNVPLIQLTTNGWGLINDGDPTEETIEIPKDVLRFNELAAKGLDLPIDLVKNLLPEVPKLPLNLIVTISLFNKTQNLTDEEYLQKMKKMLFEILSDLTKQDKLGLVILGRDRDREQSSRATFYGMINSDWDGWLEIIDDLRVTDSAKYGLNRFEEFETLLRSCNKLVGTIPELNIDDFQPNTTRKIMIVDSNTLTSSDLKDREAYRIDTYLKRLTKKYRFTIHNVLINTEYNSENVSLVETFASLQRFHYNFEITRFSSYNDFIGSIESLVQDYQETLLPNLELELEIDESLAPMIEFHQVEHNGELIAPTNKSNIKFSFHNLKDGFFKNILMNFKLDLKQLENKFQVDDEEYQIYEIPIINYKYRYLGDKMKEGQSQLKLCFNSHTENRIDKNVYNALILSPFLSPVSAQGEQAEHDDEGDELILDIPLLPPLSSGFKDSLFIKRQIELSIIKVLSKENIEEQDIDGLVSLIFELIQSNCYSTNFGSFYNDSRFQRSFKDFKAYVDSLIQLLNTIKECDRDCVCKRYDLVYALRFDQNVAKELFV